MLIMLGSLAAAQSEGTQAILDTCTQLLNMLQLTLMQQFDTQPAT